MFRLTDWKIPNQVAMLRHIKQEISRENGHFQKQKNFNLTKIVRFHGVFFVFSVLTLLHGEYIKTAKTENFLEKREKSWDLEAIFV